MRHFSSGRIRQQFRFLSRQFLQDGELPLSNVLSENIVAEVLQETDCSWVNRIYTPLVTLWVFLGQVLSADHGCRAAVSRLIAHRLSQGQDPCSSETGAYCKRASSSNAFAPCFVPRSSARAMEFSSR